MRWTVETEFIRSWLDSLKEPIARQVASALDALAAEGPSLGRPLVDTVKGSSIHNLKELRPRSTGRSEIRILFVFDDERCAVTLLAGDKAGILSRGPKWSRWYRKAIPEAERRYRQYLSEREANGHT
ncbi:MAG TPA: type II toxin-antitoxin system RelE/ParE family toxin [Candidatus Olsenella avicola]|nr:type II toxin-antitoxin system RelE/ParE family toxin [Candidatus Olsenella avicola]